MSPNFPAFRFRSDLFPIDPKEDEETNPFCYGKSVAQWLRVKFEELGYEPEPVIPEDWGWCVVLKRAPFILWVGCGNDRAEFYDKVTPEQKAAFVPNGEEILWSCLVGADAPFWTPFFWRKLVGRGRTQEQVSFVASQLQVILENEPRTQIVTDEAV